MDNLLLIAAVTLTALIAACILRFIVCQTLKLALIVSRFLGRSLKRMVLKSQPILYFLFLETMAEIFGNSIISLITNGRTKNLPELGLEVLQFTLKLFHL